MKLTKRLETDNGMNIVRDPSAGFGGSAGSAPLIVGICVGSAAFVALVVVSVCLTLRRRSYGRSDRRSPLKQFLLPKDVKPVIGFKTAAGPGGLKKSPSPVQSPENPDRDWASKSGGGGHDMGQSGHSGSSMTESMMTRSTSSSYGQSVCGGFRSRNGSMDPASVPLLQQQQHRQQCLPNTDEEDRCPLDPNAPADQSAAAPRPDDYDETKKGMVNFTLKYSFEKNALLVTIGSATNLAPKKDYRRGSRGSSPGDGNNGAAAHSLLDPYIKLQLLPEKQHKVKTRVLRNTLNPLYDEEFTFYGLSYNQLQSTTLHFAVIAFDRYSRDEIVGEIVCPLHSMDLSESDKQVSASMELMNRSSKFQNSQNRGDILVSLCYQPTTNKITAVVLKAKGLPKFDITGLADPYVKVYMLYNGQKIAKKKTHVKKRTLTPVFNESFVFDMPTNDPQAFDLVSFEFLVMDWDRVTKNEVMGRADVGLKSKMAAGRHHWEEVRKNPRKQTAEWHRLRP